MSEGVGSRLNLENAVGMSPAYMIDGDPGRSGGNTYTAQGVEPTLQDYENVFGPSARDIKQDLQRFKRHGRWHLPDILKGPNQFLTDRVDGLITDATNSPFTTKILPYRYKEDVDGKMKWNVWSFDEGLASRVPYEAAARTLTQAKRSFSAYMVRQGMAINLEHNFMMTPQGRENFSRQLNQVIGSIQMTNDLDVHIALILAPSYQKQMRERYYSEDKTPAQICREFVDLFGFVQKNTNALDILIEEAKAVLRTWGSPMPDFMLCNSKLTFQLTMTPEKTSYITQGIDGVKRLRQGPDIASYRGINIIHSRAFSMETGQRPRDVLRRRVRVAEYYRILPHKDNSESTFEFYNEQRDNFFQLSFQDLLRMARNDENRAWIDALTNPQRQGVASELLAPKRMLLGANGPGFYRGSQFFKEAEAQVIDRAVETYTVNTDMMNPSLEGISLDAADLMLIEGIEFHEKTDQLAVLLMSTLEPYFGSFNLPDIISETFVDWKQNYRTRTGNPISNCLTSYPRMPPHTFEDVFDSLLTRSSQRSTEWAELSIAPIFDDTVGTGLQAAYAGANTLPPDAWADVMELKAVKCRLELQLYMRCAVPGSRLKFNADFTNTVSSARKDNTNRDQNYGNWLYKPAACIWANPNHPLWFTVHLQEAQKRYKNATLTAAYHLIVTQEVVNVVHYMERSGKVNPTEGRTLVRDAWSRAARLLSAAPAPIDRLLAETFSALFSICLQEALYKQFRNKGMDPAAELDFLVAYSIKKHQNACCPSGAASAGVDANYHGYLIMGHGVETLPTGFTPLSIADKVQITFHDLASADLVDYVKGSLDLAFLHDASYVDGANDYLPIDSHTYDAVYIRQWSTKLLSASLPRALNPSEVDNVLAVLKLRIEGDAAYVRDTNAFVTLEQYAEACGKVQVWDQAAIGANFNNPGPHFDLAVFPLNTIWQSEHYPYRRDPALPSAPPVFGPGLSTGAKADNVEVVVVRPNIEHYMLGIILGLGGNDLGNTLWGQTELSVYDDSMHGVWGMSYKYHERAIVFNEKNLIRLWDVAYDGYNGGKDDTYVDWTDRQSVQDFRESTNNVSRNYNGKSMMVMAFQHDRVDTIKRNWPSPIVFYDTSAENAQQAGPMLPMDYENIQVIPVDEFRVFHKQPYFEQYAAYRKLMPDFKTLHATRKPAGQSSVDQETPTDSLAFQGTMRVAGKTGMRTSEVLGSGHHGVDYVGVSTVREGKGMKVATTAPTPYRMV